jgi:hypothetical protein
VPEGQVDTYKAAEVWSAYADKMLPVDGSCGDYTYYSYIKMADGATLDVTLQDRTLWKDDDWNTLCLPFAIADIETEGCPLKGATVRELDEAYITGTTLTLNFKASTTSIKAGTPYIVKWDNTEGAETTELKDPVFSDVIISSEQHDYDTETASSVVTTDERVRFIGTYKPTTFTDEDKSILFVGTGNTLYYPMSGASIGAQRAYFKIGDGTAQARLLTAINFGFDSEQTGISLTPAPSPKGEGSIYTLDGRKVANDKKSIVNGQLKKGLYIHGGKKVVIK